MESALNVATQESQAAVGKAMVDGQVQHCVAGQNLAGLNRGITLAGGIGRDLLQGDGDIPVNGRDVGVDIGRVAFGMGARFEF